MSDAVLARRRRGRRPARGRRAPRALRARAPSRRRSRDGCRRRGRPRSGRRSRRPPPAARRAWRGRHRAGGRRGSRRRPPPRRARLRAARPRRVTIPLRTTGSCPSARDPLEVAPRDRGIEQRELVGGILRRVADRGTGVGKRQVRRDLEAHAQVALALREPRRVDGEDDSAAAGVRSAREMLARGAAILEDVQLAPLHEPRRGRRDLLVRARRRTSRRPCRCRRRPRPRAVAHSPSGW